MFEELTEALSIKFSHSEDGSQFDFQSSPDKEKYSTKVKCFRCFGTHQLNCQECHGTEMISFNHPMARLLEEVLVRKLNLGGDEEDREEQLERVYPIKEEEEDSEQKKTTCIYCDRECEVTTSCSLCPLPHSCSDCSVQNPSETRQKRETIRISDCEMRFSEQKFCKNCNGEIENCYSVCLTCRSFNYNYWICGSCSDAHNYNHPSSHILETAILFDVNQSGRIELSSEIDIEESCENSSYNQGQLMEEVDLLVMNRTTSITADLRPERQSIHLRQERNKKQLVTSCVKLQIEGLFNSYDAKSQIKTSVLKPQNKKNPQNTTEKKEVTSYGSNLMPFKQDKENTYWEKNNDQKVDYVFVDYKCDRCQRQPIVNVRYHCKECEDFDVCQACYPSCKLHHEHCFEKIDGRLIREQAIQRLMDNNLLHTSNKLKRGGSCSEPLTIRQTFEALV